MLVLEFFLSIRVSFWLVWAGRIRRRCAATVIVNALRPLTGFICIPQFDLEFFLMRTPSSSKYKKFSTDWLKLTCFFSVLRKIGMFIFAVLVIDVTNPELSGHVEPVTIRFQRTTNENVRLVIFYHSSRLSFVEPAWVSDATYLHNQPKHPSCKNQNTHTLRSQPRPLKVPGVIFLCFIVPRWIHKSHQLAGSIYQSVHKRQLSSHWCEFEWQQIMNVLQVRCCYFTSSRHLFNFAEVFSWSSLCYESFLQNQLLLW